MKCNGSVADILGPPELRQSQLQSKLSYTHRNFWICTRKNIFVLNIYWILATNLKKIVANKKKIKIFQICGKNSATTWHRNNFLCTYSKIAVSVLFTRYCVFASKYMSMSYNFFRKSDVSLSCFPSLGPFRHLCRDCICDISGKYSICVRSHHGSCSNKLSKWGMNYWKKSVNEIFF